MQSYKVTPTMEEVYLVMLLALIGLAITDLVVGVSNDAVNFLNSAIGSKAFSMRNILIVASLGVAVGAIFSSGIMEVARKGIFIPGQFHFEEIMVIFMAVMITDVLLLDFFNSLGLPTSTTVSIVFELLGAAVSIALIKIYKEAGDYTTLLDYINTDKALQIILAIFLAVVLAFILGALIQFLSRLIFSFQYQKKIKFLGAIFGGVSFTAIFYFILLKGLSSVALIPAEAIDFILENGFLIIISCLIIFSLLSQLLMSLKIDILKVIVIVGTFALALAFAGNDLVNFIGVPIAAWQSFELWQEAYNANGILPSDFSMVGLAGEVPTPKFLLVISGGVMVVTLWFSKKARAVIDTGVNLSRQADGAERFEPNVISRGLVRYFLMFGNIVTYITPRPVQKFVTRKFMQKRIRKHGRELDAPAFDLVRASVNLVVASVLISIGTNYKLPLSTTYVTFMVAMGTSLADRAWGRESAVYRVAGVLNVVGGWFVTAIVAFSVAAIFAAIIYFGGITAIAVLIGVAIFNITRTTVIHSRKLKEAEK
ncbi:MAG TPA: inorganic phosphate transporter, partial [Salinimicrobium sp.]|nr:inorganic phosphate transporter [Salinimicrobium sp.]